MYMRLRNAYTIHLFGGPISVDSKKFDDPGDSTPYNEYMALYYCSRRAMWTRNIIREINYYNESLIYYITKAIKAYLRPHRGRPAGAMIQHAMILYGDNDTATARAKERKMTMNDRHVALKYHTVTHEPRCPETERQQQQQQRARTTALPRNRAPAAAAAASTHHATTQIQSACQRALFTGDEGRWSDGGTGARPLPRPQFDNF
jgi:hypothetical protein